MCIKTDNFQFDTLHKLFAFNALFSVCSSILGSDDYENNKVDIIKH